MHIHIVYAIYIYIYIYIYIHTHTYIWMLMLSQVSLSICLFFLFPLFFFIMNIFYWCIFQFTKFFSLVTVSLLRHSNNYFTSISVLFICRTSGFLLCVFVVVCLFVLHLLPAFYIFAKYHCYVYISENLSRSVLQETSPTSLGKRFLVVISRLYHFLSFQVLGYFCCDMFL